MFKGINKGEEREKSREIEKPLILFHRSQDRDWNLFDSETRPDIGCWSWAWR